jgi:hypothetical protein
MGLPCCRLLRMLQIPHMRLRICSHMVKASRTYNIHNMLHKAIYQIRAQLRVRKVTMTGCNASIAQIIERLVKQCLLDSRMAQSGRRLRLPCSLENRSMRDPRPAAVFLRPSLEQTRTRGRKWRLRKPNRSNHDHVDVQQRLPSYHRFRIYRRPEFNGKERWRHAGTGSIGFSAGVAPFAGVGKVRLPCGGTET